MIRVPRKRKDSRGRTIQPSKGWFTKSRCLTKQAHHEGPAHIVDERHYGADDVRMALEKLFYGKCAYCETPLAESGWDVDHYRPKKRVHERPDHPGYYWLAYTWSNLYPACSLCNQRRRDKPHWDGPTRVSDTAGKLDQFPIDDEDHRAMSPADHIERELPYLLDPCEDEGSLYLLFDSQGNVAAIDDNVFGKKTIHICHLWRSRLTTSRAKIIAEVSETLRIRDLAVRAGVDAIVERMDRRLAQACSAAAPHAAVARAVCSDPEAYDAPPIDKRRNRRRRST